MKVKQRNHIPANIHFLLILHWNIDNTCFSFEIQNTKMSLANQEVGKILIVQNSETSFENKCLSFSYIFSLWGRRICFWKHLKLVVCDSKFRQLSQNPQTFTKFIFISSLERVKKPIFYWKKTSDRAKVFVFTFFFKILIEILFGGKVQI